MSSMTPTALSKCVAPCLQLWSAQEDTPIMEMVDLNLDFIQNAMQDSKEDDDVLFLDSPQQFIVCNARRFLDSNTTTAATSNGKDIIQTPPKLAAAIAAAKQWYRTPPSMRLALSSAPSTEDHQDNEAIICLDNALVEDKPAAGGIRDFDEWKMNVASMVQE